MNLKFTTDLEFLKKKRSVPAKKAERVVAEMERKFANPLAAARYYAKKFEKRNVRNLGGLVKPLSRVPSREKLSRADKKALQSMKRNLLSSFPVIKFRNGKNRWSEISYEPVRRVGLYVPGMRAAYPSSVLMGGLAARRAGVRDLVLITPPDSRGRIASLVVEAARLCAVREVLLLGGAQAVFLAAYGTKGFSPVDMIVGPGNEWVMAAKKRVFGKVKVDFLPGPSEVGILECRKGREKILAARLAAQAEHGPGGFCVVFSNQRHTFSALKAELRGKVNGFTSYFYYKKERSRLVRDLDELAFEHVEVLDARASDKEKITAGTVILGERIPTAATDYGLGPNHILPTGGAARAFGAFSPLQFFLARQYVRAGVPLPRRDLQWMKHLALREGLPFHAESFDVQA